MLADKKAIIPVVVTIICLIPFVNKAFNIDEPLFIWTAKHILVKPADFYGFSVNWYGFNAPMSKITKNPPISCYYLAGAAALLGFNEAAIHTAFLLPAIAAALGIYYLAKKFCSQPVYAALAAILTPGFLVSSTNIMCDTMMLAFWVWAIYFWVEGIETNKYWNLFFAAVLVAICALTKYFGMSLLILLAVYSIMKTRRPGAWILFLLVPVVVLAGYQWLTYKLYGRGLLSDAAVYAGSRNLAKGLKLPLKLFTGLFFAGGCIVTALFCGLLLWSRRVLISGIAATALFILILSAAKKIGAADVRDTANNINWGFLVQAGLMAAGGVSILWLGIVDFWKCRNAESLLLLLWVFGTFIFASLINWSVNARSVLPMVPAVGILLMRRIERHNNKKTSRKIKMEWMICPLICGAILSLLVCRADYIWANTTRSAAAVISKTFENSGHAVWFQGHWGFQYYMEGKGCKAFDFSNSICYSGDVIIVPVNNTNISSMKTNKLLSLKPFQFTACRGLSTMSLRLGAGFYADIWGPLPFAIGPVDAEKYYAFAVK